MLDSWGGNCKLVCDRVSEDTGVHWRHTGEGGLTSMSAERFPMPCSRRGQRDPQNNMGHRPTKGSTRKAEDETQAEKLYPGHI